MIKLNWHIMKTKLRSHCSDRSISTVSDTVDRSIECTLPKKHSPIKIPNSCSHDKTIALIFSVNDHVEVF